MGLHINLLNRSCPFAKEDAAEDKRRHLRARSEEEMKEEAQS